MQKILLIEPFSTYKSGIIRYRLSKTKRDPEGLIAITVPDEITSKTKQLESSARIECEMQNEYHNIMRLDPVYPLGMPARNTGAGLGSFILSHTFLKIYDDSINSYEITPQTELLIDTKTPELISILKNRSFQKGILGYMTTIQNAAKQSERILSKRNWI